MRNNLNFNQTAPKCYTYKQLKENEVNSTVEKVNSIITHLELGPSSKLDSITLLKQKSKQ